MRMLYDVISRLVGAIGRLSQLMAILAALVCFATVYMRYALGVTWIWLNESYIWANAFAIVLAAGWAWRDDALVRVDLFYERFSERGRAAVDAVGIVVFLAPTLWVLWRYASPYVALSWRMSEGSAQPGGLPAMWALKGSLLLLAALLTLQGIAELARNLLVLAGAVRTTVGARHGSRSVG